MAKNNIDKVFLFCFLCMFVNVYALHEFIDRTLKSEIIMRQFSDSETLTKRSTDHKIVKRQTDNLQKPQCKTFVPENAFKSKFVIKDDVLPRISLAWSMIDDITAVTTEYNEQSHMYQSTDGGKTFLKAISKVHNSNISSINGLQKHHIAPTQIYLVADDAQHLFISNNSGTTFDEVTLNFRFYGNIIFHPNASYTNYLMILSDEKLYLSQDNGIHWTKIKDRVISAKWGAVGVDSPQTIYCTVSVKDDEFSIANWFGLDKANKDYDLEKSDNLGDTMVKVHKHVYAFGVKGAFIYVSVFLDLEDEENDKRVLEVSKDQGKNWYEVQLPAIEPERFYSILDMSDDMIMMHVDYEGGYGTIYTSDATGIIYSESLKRHFYPNTGGFTDFYAVKSMRGVYITSQLSNDGSLQTVISYDRGGEWKRITRPDDVQCKSGSKDCHLHISGLYSLTQGVNASLPLSVPSAKGLILAHGHIADAQQISAPDVFITTDGGYKWRKTLDGPHHYQIGDQGGLLVAVPLVNMPKVVKFSVDEGNCWNEYKFTNESITVGGLLTAPGNTEMVVTIWGYGNLDRHWRVFTLDFDKVIKSNCKDADYETWSPEDPSEDSGCFLGLKETFIKIKKNSWCRNQRGLDLSKKTKTEPCPCKKADYDCDYGYFRNNSENCILDPLFKGPKIDICLRGHEENIISYGYHKIPGDKCVNTKTNSFHTRDHQLIDLNKLCKEGDRSVLDSNLNSDVNTSDVNTVIQDKLQQKCRSTTALAAVLVVMVLLVVILLVYVIHRKIFAKKRYNRGQESDSCRLVIAVEVNEDDPGQLNNVQPTSTQGAINHAFSQYNGSQKSQEGKNSEPNNLAEQPKSDNSATHNGDDQPLGMTDNTPKVFHDDSDDDLIE